MMQVFPREPPYQNGEREEKEKEGEIGETVVNHFCVSRVRWDWKASEARGGGRRIARKVKRVERRGLKCTGDEVYGGDAGQ